MTLLSLCAEVEGNLDVGASFASITDCGFEFVFLEGFEGGLVEARDAGAFAHGGFDNGSVFIN